VGTKKSRRRRRMEHNSRQ